MQKHKDKKVMFLSVPFHNECSRSSTIMPSMFHDYSGPDEEPATPANTQEKEPVKLVAGKNKNSIT